MSVKLIKDPVWGSFSYFPHEGFLLRTPIFARLQRIKQTSLSHYVFPGATHSRLQHSLGVVHVATKIYFHGLQTDDKNALDKFMNEAIEFYNEARLSENSVNYLQHYWSSLPAHVALSFTLVRLMAFLHDIGHLPYSHLFEKAVEEHDKNVGNKNERICPDNTKMVFHETFGESLLSLLSWYLVDKKAYLLCRDKSEVSEEALVFLTELVCLLVKIKQVGANPYLITLETIMKGTIDADRCDCVARDSFFSGLQHSVDFNRLFTLYKLQMLDGNACFLPSDKSKADIVSLLLDRFRTRKLFTCHHRVVLVESLMRRVLSSEVIKQQKDYLMTVFSYSDKWNQYLQALTQYNNAMEQYNALTPIDDMNLDYTDYTNTDAEITLKKNQATASKDTLNIFFRGQIGNILYFSDDSWLDTRLRELYRDYNPNATGNEKMSKESIKYLHALLLDHKVYFSIWKRNLDFWKKIEIGFGLSDDDVRKIKVQWRLHRTNNNIHFFVELQSYVFAEMIELFRNKQLNLHPWYILFENYSEKLKPGLPAHPSAEFNYYNDTGALGVLFQYINEETIDDPQFFVYCHCECLEKITKEKIEETVINGVMRFIMENDLLLPNQ